MTLRWLGLVVATIVAVLSSALPGAVAATAPPPATAIADAGASPTIPPNERLGIAHVSYGVRGADEQRYALARGAGAAWNRWVAYWTEIERAPGVFDYSRHDATVASDLQHGLQLDVVLMGTPGFYATTSQAQIQAAGKSTTPASSAPRNLEQPVFADGSDELASGKAINADNYWARFVGTTVARYRGHVRYWEIWNEPDFSTFWWTGDGQEVAHYLRLLKVAYLAAKSVDPDALIVIGGLMNWEWSNRLGVEHAWLRAFLHELAADPDHERYGSYFDVLALHWYARSRDLYDRTLAARQLLAAQGIPDKLIWINETDLGVCGDPQNGGKPDCTPGVPKGRPDEQASFILQALANAFAAGADKLFVFQLVDDEVKPFDYYGLVRNDGSPRPAYAAYQVAARYFRELGVVTKLTLQSVELVRMVRYDGSVVSVVWNSAPQPVSVAIPAMATSALLVGQSGETRTIPAGDGVYALNLPGATLNLTGNAARPDYPVGGYTYAIVESPEQDPPTSTEASATAIPPAEATPTLAAPTPTVAVPPTATPTATPTPAGSSTGPALGGAPTTTATMTATAPAGGGDPAPPSRSRHLAADVLAMPAGLSTVRISDVHGDRFTVSWVSSAPATGVVRCGTAVPLAERYEEPAGSGWGSLTHLVVVTGRQPDTAYFCEVQAGVEFDNNGGAYFRATTGPGEEAGSAVPITGAVVDEQGRAKGDVLVYGALDDRCLEGSPSAVAATRTGDDGHFALAIAGPVDDGRCPAADGSSGGQRVHLSAVGAVVLAAERDAGVGERLDEPLRLGFTWSPYPSVRVPLPAGWSELSLPLRPLGPLTVDDFAREVAAQGGSVAGVFWQEDDHWQGGPAAGSTVPLVYGRRYLVDAERASTWVMRGLAP